MTIHDTDHEYVVLCNSAPPDLVYETEEVHQNDAMLTDADRDEYVYFDNCATTCTVRDESLLIDLRPGGRAMGISGSVPGEKLVTNIYGQLGDLGRQPYSPQFRKNLISEKVMRAAGWHIKHNTETHSDYFCNKPGHVE